MSGCLKVGLAELCKEKPTEPLKWSNPPITIPGIPNPECGIRNPAPGIRDLEPEALYPKGALQGEAHCAAQMFEPETSNPQFGIRDPKPYTPKEKPEFGALNPKPSTRNPKPRDPEPRNPEPQTPTRIPNT